MGLADDKQDYKTHLAASLFADVLRKERTDAVAVGTDKTEQEAQAETKEQTKNVEVHEEEDKKEEQKEEQTQSEKVIDERLDASLVLPWLPFLRQHQVTPILRYHALPSAWELPTGHRWLHALRHG